MHGTQSRHMQFAHNGAHTCCKAADSQNSIATARSRELLLVVVITTATDIYFPLILNQNHCKSQYHGRC